MDSTKEWIEEEFNLISFNDKRLDKRLIKVASTLTDAPQSPINQAFEDWQSVKAAYNFFNNPKVKTQKIWQAHYNCTLNRIESHPIVLAVQDTVILDYSSHIKLKGKGPTGTRKQHLSGYLMHHTMAFTPQGVPLGLLTNHIWARKEIKENRNLVNNKLPTSQKESYKWIRALKDIQAQNIQNAQVIHICDAEADFLDFFEAADKLNARFIIRAHFDRLLLNDSNRLWDFMSQRPVILSKIIEVQRNTSNTHGKTNYGIKEAREAQIEIRVGTISIKLKNKSIILNAIFIKEKEDSLQKDPLEWMLLTSLNIESKEDIEQIINFYKIRWQIEEYHKVLKSGCRVEECRLESTAAMKRYIALFCIIAWRLFWLNRSQRVSPEKPCTIALTELEWKALYCKIHHTPHVPDQVPNLRQAVHWIARLGGFLNRKGDGEPGLITLWRGWSRLRDIVEDYEFFKEHHEAIFLV
jgi:hypothetical protein